MEASSLPLTEIKVSVCMITYNHEAFISQAIEGVLMQQTDFPVELLIGEDCSTDRTRQIVQEYAARYPGRIRPLLNEHNLGAQLNFIATLKACHGKYIALCEGDDYWTDSHKLQQQVDFLERHPECVTCFHSAFAYYQDGSHPTHLLRPVPLKSNYTLEDLLKKNFIPTLTVMFCNGHINELPNWYYQGLIGDWPLHIFNAQYGSIGYIDKPMAVYRIHNTGIYSSASIEQRLNELVRVYRNLEDQFGSDYQKQVRSGLSACLLSFAIQWLDDGALEKARSCFFRSLEVAPFQQWLDRSVAFMRLYLPSLYRNIKPLYALFTGDGLSKE